MTKKDYVLIARVIAVVNADVHHGLDAYRAMAMLVNEMTKALEDTNPRFDAQRFYEACNVSEIEAV